jgi:hypothetical protein
MDDLNLWHRYNLVGGREGQVRGDFVFDGFEFGHPRAAFSVPLWRHVLDNLREFVRRN